MQIENMCEILKKGTGTQSRSKSEKQFTNVTIITN